MQLNAFRNFFHTNSHSLTVQLKCAFQDGNMIVYVKGNSLLHWHYDGVNTVNICKLVMSTLLTVLQHFPVKVTLASYAVGCHILWQVTVVLLVVSRASEAVKQMELSQKHEAEETAALEKMMQNVEANLEATTVIFLLQ